MRTMPKPTVHEMRVVRELAAEDVEELEKEHTQAPKAALLRITQRHHKVARLIAQGVGTAAITLATGYQPRRIQELAADPAFKGLVAFY